METWLIVALVVVAGLILYILYQRNASASVQVQSTPGQPSQIEAPLPSAPSSGVTKQKAAVEVSDVELEQYLLDPNKPSVVMYYSPGCGHCKAMMPAYTQYGLAAGNNVHVLKVDCSRFTNIADKYNIKGYPTIKLFQKGQVVKDYDGDRKLGSFLAFHSGN